MSAESLLFYEEADVIYAAEMRDAAAADASAEAERRCR